MNLVGNIKTIRETKNLKQIDIANHFRLIDKMLNNIKFQIFFQQNLQTVK